MRRALAEPAREIDGRLGASMPGLCGFGRGIGGASASASAALCMFNAPLPGESMFSLTLSNIALF